MITIIRWKKFIKFVDKVFVLWSRVIEKLALFKILNIRKKSKILHIEKIAIFVFSLLNNNLRKLSVVNFFNYMLIKCLCISSQNWNSFNEILDTPMGIHKHHLSFDGMEMIKKYIPNALKMFQYKIRLLFCPWNFPGKKTGVGYHFLLQGIFLTKGLNPSLQCLLQWQADSLPLCQVGSPSIRKDLVSLQVQVLSLIASANNCQPFWHLDLNHWSAFYVKFLFTLHKNSSI